MHVEKQKIIDGIVKYIEKDVMPEISSDRGFQVVISIGVSAIKANNKLLDKLFENDIFKSLANYDDENKTYDIDLLYNIAKEENMHKNHIKSILIDMGVAIDDAMCKLEGSAEESRQKF